VTLIWKVAYVPKSEPHKANNWQPTSTKHSHEASYFIQLAQQNGGLFVDSEFPANDSSLGTFFFIRYILFSV
jgi:hypothetical protein